MIFDDETIQLLFPQEARAAHRVGYESGWRDAADAVMAQFGYTALVQPTRVQRWLLHRADELKGDE